jgi:hypothetical protein
MRLSQDNQYLCPSVIGALMRYLLGIRLGLKRVPA